MSYSAGALSMSVSCGRDAGWLAGSAGLLGVTLNAVATAGNDVVIRD